MHPLDEPTFGHPESPIPNPQTKTFTAYTRPAHLIERQALP
jgi:hypothetical protein